MSESVENNEDRASLPAGAAPGDALDGPAARPTPHVPRTPAEPPESADPPSAELPESRTPTDPRTSAEGRTPAEPGTSAEPPESRMSDEPRTPADPPESAEPRTSAELTESPEPRTPADPGVGPRSPAGRLARLVERLRAEVEAAHAAADGRALIEMAKGLLIERLGCGPAQAARQLERLAEQAGVSPLEFAADLVDRTAQDGLTRTVRELPRSGGTRRSRLAAGGEPYAPESGAGESAAGARPVPPVSVRLRSAESAALTAATADAVAASFLRHALAPLGGVAVAIWAVHPDTSLTLAGTAGLSPREAARWHHVPPRLATPARAALSRRETLWLRNLAEDRLASVGQQELPDGPRVVVPARVNGRTLGALEICWGQQPPERVPAVLRQIEALGELSGHALEEAAPAAVPSLAATYPQALELTDLADGLDIPALVLVPVVEEGGLVGDFRLHHVNQHFTDPAGRHRSALIGTPLLEAYPLAAEEGGLFEKIEHVYATGEPFRARLALTALVDDVPVSSWARAGLSRHGACVLVVWRIETEADRLAGLLQHAQRLGRIGGFEEDYRTGEITWNEQLHALYGLSPGAPPVPLEQLEACAHPDDGPAVGRFLRGLLRYRRPASTAFRLRRPDGVTRYVRVVAEPLLDATGTVAAVRGAYQDVSAQHWTEVALAATREQLAHTEQQAAERNRLALQLQRAIMPATRGPMRLSGLQIAVRYRPAEQEHLVGGDWYDAVQLPGGKVLLCVGDVAGHGIDAATGMVVLRNALRGLAATGAGPGQLLAWLNNVAAHLTEQVTATVVCGLYDPADRELRWARAGHLPPVLLRDGRAGSLPLPRGILLGALPDAEYEEQRVELRAGDALLLFTDGLVERKDRSPDEAVADLCASAGETTGLEALMDQLLLRSNADTDDDTCLVGIRLD